MYRKQTKIVDAVDEIVYRLTTWTKMYVFIVYNMSFKLEVWGTDRHRYPMS